MIDILMIISYAIIWFIVGSWYGEKKTESRNEKNNNEGFNRAPNENSENL